MFYYTNSDLPDFFFHDWLVTCQIVLLTDSKM